MRLSPSKINHFFNCPYMFWCEEQKLEGLPKGSKSAAIGKNIHEIIGVYFRTLPDPITPKQIETHALDVMDKNIDFALKPNKRRIKTLMLGFIELETRRLTEAKTYRPTFIEREFTNTLWHGFADMYYDTTLVDWKTNRQALIGPDLMRQGMIYKLSAEQEGYVVDRVQYVFLSDRRVLTMPKSTAGWIMNERRKMLDMLKHERYPKRRTPGCKYCPYEIRCDFGDCYLWVM